MSGYTVRNCGNYAHLIDDCANVTLVDNIKVVKERINGVLQQVVTRLLVLIKELKKMVILNSSLFVNKNTTVNYAN